VGVLSWRARLLPLRAGILCLDAGAFCVGEALGCHVVARGGSGQLLGPSEVLEVDLLDLTCARMMRGRGEAHEVVLARHPRVMDVSHQHAQSSNASFFFARLGVSAVTRTSVRFGHEVREPLPVIFSSQGCDAGGQYCSGGTSWAAG